MKRCFVKINIIALLWIAFGCTVRPAERKDITELSNAVENELPYMQIRLLDASQIDVRQLTGKIVLIFYQPDCDHCQREASEIAQNIAAFKGASLYFITSDVAEKAARFANEYKLSRIQHVYFGLTSTESVLKNFGPIATPSIYIYSEDRKLIKAFNGEVNISTILKYI